MSSPSADSTDVSLLKRVQRGDEIAWTRFDQLYRPLVTYWCRRAGLGDADGDDIFQEVLEAVHHKIHSFDKDRPRATFRGWLFTITRNKLRDAYTAKKQRREEPLHAWLDRLEHLDAEEAAPEPASQVILVQRIRDLIRGEFSDQHWQAFQYHAIEKLTAPEAAARLGMSAAAVRQAKARVLHRLREEFDELL